MPRFIPPDEWISEGVKPGELSEQTLFNDYWDRKILDKSLISISDFAAARDELADAVPTGGPAMSDTFWALLKAIPRVLDNGAIRPSHLVNAMVMDEALQLPELQRLRHLSVNDDVQAALSAAELEPDIESLFDKLSEEQKKADELQELLQGLAATLAGIAADEADLAAMPGGSAPNQSDGEGNGEGDGEGAGQDALTDEEKEALNAKAEAIAEAKAQADELRQQAEAAAQELGDSLEEASATVSVDLSRALDKAATSADNLRQSALAWGLSPGELQRMDAKERLELARTLQSDRFRRIADRWGPMHSLALSEQARKANHVPEEIYDTELGNHLGRILPSELIALHHPLLRKNFLRKYVSRGLMQYAMRGTEKLSRGGIIFCADEETEILTSEGWKRYDELRVGDQVLTLNHEAGLSEWQPTERVNIFEPERRQMLSMEGQRHSSLTTMDHRWPVLTSSRKRGGKRVWRRNWRTSATLTQEDRIQVAAPCSNLEVIQKHSDAIVELVAWTWTEGTILPPGSSLRIYQSERVNPDHCASIRAALTSEFGPATKLDMRTIREQQIAAWREETNEHTGITSFHLNVWASRPILDHLDDDKVVDPAFIAQLTRSQLELFVAKSLDGDGQRRAGVDILGQRVESRNRSFEMACVLLGLPVNTVAYDEKRPDRAPGTKQYFTSARKGHPDTITIHNKGTFKREIIEHDGIVWCPTTPNGTWLARRRGTIYFTGNCEDGSGSMSGEREIWAKAVMLCLLDLAKRQKREMHVIHFGSPNQYRHIEFGQPGDFTFQRIVEAAELFFNGGPLRVDQRMATPHGWKPIGEAKVGDTVLSVDGQPTEIIGVYPQGELDLYEVTFRDGAKVVCDGTHIWTVRNKLTGSPDYVDLTLKQMLDAGLDYTHDNGHRYNFSVPMAQPLEIDPSVFDIDPYLLGYLLGDGTLGGGKPVQVHSSELEHPWNEVLPPGITVSTYAEPTQERCGTYGLVGEGRGKSSKNSLISGLKEIGLWGLTGAAKFVPGRYLWGSIEQRHALLSGLLDSDGNVVAVGGFEFSNISLALCEGVVHLAQSLGGVATLTASQVRPNEQPRWNVRGRIDSTLPPPFRLTRKKDAYVTHKNPYLRSIVSAERVEKAEAICIKTARDDGLFLTEGMVVTHNTDFETPMKVSLDILRGQFSRTGAVRADVVFITDDECYVRDAFMEEYLGEMHRMQATTWGISAAGGIRKGGALDQMCEGKTCQVKDFLSGEDVRHVFRGV